jgi:hypothetical protein
MPMPSQTPASADDRSSSLAFLLVAAFASSLVWAYMMLGHLALR